jgi:hypothetical protein
MIGDMGRGIDEGGVPSHSFHDLARRLYAPFRFGDRMEERNGKMTDRLPVGAGSEDEGERATKVLLTELRMLKSDLARLVERVWREQRQYVVVSARAVEAWEKREPRAWAAVRTWLGNRGVEVLTVRQERP